MYAIVDIAGQQMKVEKDDKVFVHRLDAEEGSLVSFDKVLLVDNNGKVQVGTPVVANTIVTAKIISHLKDDTVKVFKKKRRKGYQTLNGHRQFLSEIEITGIGAGKAPKATAKKEVASEKKAAPVAKAEAPKVAAKPAAKKPAAKKATTEAKPAAKKPAAKKATTAAKPTAKKPAAKKESTAAKAKKPATKKADPKD